MKTCEVEKRVAPFPLGKAKVNQHAKEASSHFTERAGKSGGTASSKTRPEYIKVLVCSGRVFYFSKRSYE